MSEFFGHFDIWQVLSSFIFLIAIIDPFGNIPITVALEEKGKKIHPLRVSIASFVILMAFLFAGEWILKLFGVQIEYFAIAGGFVIFLMALEVMDRWCRWHFQCTRDLVLLQHYWPLRLSIRYLTYAFRCACV